MSVRRIVSLLVAAVLAATVGAAPAVARHLARPGARALGAAHPTHQKAKHKKATHKKAKHKKVKRRPASHAKAAQTLAAHIARARTVSAETRALMAALKALHIGVYTAAGKPLQRGAERGVRDFYLYDFEVKAIANGLLAHQTYGLSDLSGLLSQVSGTQISADQLGALLHAGVRGAVRHPADPTALLPLLVRDLGLRDRPRYDPSKTFSVATARLDAAQYFLLNASFLGGALRHDNAGAHAAIAAPGIVTAADGPCPDVHPDTHSSPQLGDQALGWWGKRELKKLSDKVATAFKVKSLISKIIAGLHGSLLAYSLRVQALDTSLSTHYGPLNAGLAPDAGTPITFRAQVVMLDDLGDQTINCLALAGIKLPHKGPVPGVPIQWQYAQGDLLAHGTVSPAGGPLGPKSTTGADGIATLTFTPNDELIPGLGVDTHDTGVVDGIALWQDAFGNGAGLYGIKWNEYVTPIFSGVRWDVGYHNQLATLDVASTTSGSSDHTYGSPLNEHDTSDYQYGMQASIPIQSATGGSGPMTWTAFHSNYTSYFPRNSGQCFPGGAATDTDTGQNPAPGSVTVQQITGLPNISVTLAVVPGSYNIHHVGTSTDGCGDYSNDSSTTYDAGFRNAQGIDVRRVADNVYKITGWTPGAPGSGVYATKTITLSDGTITLKITPRFG